MIASFNYRSFKEHLRSPLEVSELHFIKRTFFYASTYFCLFGFLVTILHFLCLKLFGNSTLFSGACVFLGMLSSWPLAMFSIKYNNNPVRVPNSFVQACFVLLTVSLSLFFLGFMRFLAKIIGTENNTFFMGVIASVFGIAFLIYLIPAFIGLTISQRSKICSLNKFVNYCYLSYFFIFILQVILGWHVYKFNSGWGMFGLILHFIITICSPVITFYKLKTVAYYINYEDNEERRKWENFFAFVIVHQLLNLAFTVLVFVVRLLARTGGSRI